MFLEKNCDFPPTPPPASETNEMEPIWSPHVIQNLKDSDLGLYQEFSRTACILGGGCSAERALQVLYQSNGDIKLAMERLLSKSHHSDQTNWTEDEVNQFERLIMLHGKNFFLIRQDLKTKTVKECVEFYYLWKKSPIRNIAQVAAEVLPQPQPRLKPQSQQQQPQSQQQLPCQVTVKKQPPSGPDVFPCKICGRIFEKIKSRSAHMKRHKNEK